MAMVALKTKVSEWLSIQLDENGLGKNLNRENLLGKDEIIEFGFREEGDCDWKEDFVYEFDGFPDQIIIFLDEVREGIIVGYRVVKWDGPATPLMTKMRKHLIVWADFDHMNEDERHAELLDRLMRTINTRKRHYRKCQLCGERTAREHRFDEKTCHTCATTDFGVVY